MRASFRVLNAKSIVLYASRQERNEGKERKRERKFGFAPLRPWREAPLTAQNAAAKHSP
jgi:hypothetical protein